MHDDYDDEEFDLDEVEDLRLARSALPTARRDAAVRERPGTSVGAALKFILFLAIFAVSAWLAWNMIPYELSTPNCQRAGTCPGGR